MSPVEQYVIDAFTDRPFSGNPAAVCILPSWRPDTDLQQLAAENNLSETAFIVAEVDGYRLRWFTPCQEVDLCGHATLAAAYAVFHFVAPTLQRVQFQTNSGPISVRRQEKMLEMCLPVWSQHQIPVTGAMENAFGQRPLEALLGTDLVCVFPDADTVRNLQPDQKLLAQLPGRLQNATAPGSLTDCASRSFGPKLGITEDPVCGSAHCQIAPYWAGWLQRPLIQAEQVSARGGHLECFLPGDGTMLVRAAAVPVSAGRIIAF